jgi:hypothetical protein
MLTAEMDFSVPSDAGFHADQDDIDGRHLVLGRTCKFGYFHLQRRLFADFADEGIVKTFTRFDFASRPFPVTGEMTVFRGTSEQQTAPVRVDDNGSN